MIKDQLREQRSQNKRSRANEKGALIVPLLSCGKHIFAHAHSVGGTDVESEIDLILARGSRFTAPYDISRMTICPAHRSSLCTGWRRGSRRCRVPEILSSHAHGNSARLTVESKTIFERLMCRHIYCCWLCKVYAVLLIYDSAVT